MTEEATGAKKSGDALTKVMGMFKCKGNKGQYISGKAGFDITIKAGQKVYLFINERKQHENQPDYNLLVKGGVTYGKKEETQES